MHEQHVTSKLLMKRFASTSKLIESISVVYPQAKSRMIGPRAAGKVTDFVPFASASMERVWNEVEQRLPDALALCDRDTLYGDHDAVVTVRNAIALHFARSLHTRELHRSSYAEVRAALRSRISDELLDALFRQRHGLHVPAGGVQTRELAFDELVKLTDDDFRSGALLRARIQMLFDDAKLWLARPNCEIEIVKPAEGTFLIGDVPALSLGHDDRVGVLGGVALGSYGGMSPQLAAARTDRLVRDLGLINRDRAGFVPHRQVEAHVDSSIANVLGATPRGDLFRDRCACQQRFGVLLAHQSMWRRLARRPSWRPLASFLLHNELAKQEGRERFIARTNDPLWRP